MKKIILAASLFAMFSGSAAQAGVYSDDLSKCLVSSTTTQERTDLVRWIFATAALHPEVSDVVSVSAEKRTEMNRSAADLFMRLLTEACRKQFRDAMKYEGEQALRVSFEVLGQVAMRSLLDDPAVTKGFGELDLMIDQEKIKSVVSSEEPEQP